VARLVLLCSLALAMLAAAPAGAVQPDEVLRDPALEQRARALSRELRCMVCQNESIDESNAPLARDLRLIVRERLTAGDSDAQVIEFLVARYGEFVLLRPRLSAGTILLWATPALVLLLGGAVLVVLFRRRPVQAEAAPLTPEEEARVEAVLRDAPPPRRITER
jgi:cytochrome c-type biogenesis protein CcmH